MIMETSETKDKDFLIDLSSIKISKKSITYMLIESQKSLSSIRHIILPVYL